MALSPTSSRGPTFGTATVVLTNAQIRTLPTARVQVVAAPGAGKIVVPLYCLCVIDASAGVYTVEAGSSWQLLYGPTGGIEASGLGLPALNSLQLPAAGVGVWSVVVPDFAGTTGAAGFDGYLYGTSKPSRTNLGLYIADYFNGIGDYTGGNAANTLTVMTAYAVLSLSA